MSGVGWFVVSMLVGVVATFGVFGLLSLVSTPWNRTQGVERLLAYVDRRGRGEILCCRTLGVGGFATSSVYWGGATMPIRLAERFGEVSMCG